MTKPTLFTVPAARPGGEFARVRAALAASVHFRGLATDDLDQLAALARPRRLRGGELVSKAGSRQQDVWIVISGGVRMSSVTRDGREFVYALLGPGGFYGIGSLIAEAKTTVDAHAVGATSLAVIEGTRFIALLNERRHLWRYIAALLHRRLTLAMSVVRDITFAPLPQRIARRLLSQAMSSGGDIGDERRIELRLTQSDLGRMLGASRSKVNQELKRLERSAVLKVRYRSIALVDLAQLRELAGPNVQAF